MLRHKETPQEEVITRPEVHQIPKVQVGLQREVPVRPEGRPGQGQDDEDDTKMDIYLFCNFFQFVIFCLNFEEEDLRRNATQTKPVLSPHVASRNLVQFCLYPTLSEIYRLTNTLLQALS